MAQGEHDDLILKAGLGLAVIFFVVKPLISDLGLGDNPNIAYVDTLTPEANPFSMNYKGGGDINYKFSVEYLSDLNNRWIAAGSPGYEAGGGEFNIPAIATAIYNCFSFWTDVDTNGIMAAFDAITSKDMLAEVVAYFNYAFGDDLWTMLKHGLKFLGFLGSGGGIGSDNVTAIVNRMKSLPEL
jgi:hypothetical protein